MENQVSEFYMEEQDSEATKESKIIRQNFQIFGVATFLFACFYTFCMYKNDAGITYLFLVAAGLYYIKYCGKKLGIATRKGTMFYVVGTLLLGVSTFCTDDARIICFNKTGVFLLMVSLVLYNVFETKTWGPGKYITTIIRSILWSWGEWPRPFGDARYCCKNKLGSKGKTIWYAAAGVAASVPVVVLVLRLLMSADVLFGTMAERLLESLNLENVAGISLLTILVFFSVYGFLSFVVKGEIKEEVTEGKKAEAVLAIPMAAILTVLYLVFSMVQIGGLFLGKLALPAGYTYAVYAREGFFQLLAVSVLNLLLVLAGMRFFKESKILKVLLTLMCLCTFIMIASSAMRMVLYIKTYHLTFLRILVLWGLLVLFVLFAGVITNLYRKQFSLFRYSVVVVTVCYLGLSFARPDYWIAKYNISQMNSVIAMDTGYLLDLSADAAPVLVPYFGMKKEESRWNTESADSVRKFNVSRFVAKRLLENP